jgi:uncharacterized membrane protein
MAQRYRQHHATPTRHPLLPLVVVLTALAATIAGMVTLWPRGDVRRDLAQFGVAQELYEATVTGISTAPCRGSPAANPVICQNVAFQLLQGPDSGDSFLIELPSSRSAPELEEGDKVVLARQRDAQPGFEYVYVDRQRRPILLALAALFALAVVLLGRLRGLSALAGLAATFVVLLLFVLPAILGGQSPILVAIVGASAIAFLALYLAHGFTLMTTVALLGTLFSLGLTLGLATLFVELADFTGFVSDEAGLVTIGAERLDLAGLVLGGVVIGALGAIDDMTVTQASAVWELRAVNPEMERPTLFRSALRIGRDHVASTVNTLFLAYAGASMPLLLLFVLSRQSLGSVANGEVVATEIVRTLVGSIGLVASVPVTTWLAARLAPLPGSGRERPRSRWRERRRLRKARNEEDRWPFEG